MWRATPKCAQRRGPTARLRDLPIDGRNGQQRQLDHVDSQVQEQVQYPNDPMDAVAPGGRLGRRQPAQWTAENAVDVRLRSPKR